MAEKIDDREAGYRDGFGQGYSRAITDVIGWLHAHPIVPPRSSWLSVLARWARRFWGRP